ncbi:hypothetical protein INT45_009693, partial [Circinella minor]
TGSVSQAAIFGLNGSQWAASPSFQVSANEVQDIIAGFSNSEKILESGIHIAGTKYLTLRADDRSIYGKKGADGVCLVKTNQAVLIAIYKEGIQPGSCTTVVEGLADYLISVSYKRAKKPNSKSKNFFIVLILGAGYGTRLQRDLNASSDYKHLLGVPKALLPLGGRDALITHWLDLFRSHNITDIYVVTNAATYDAFISWAERNQVPSSNIVSDGTLTNETRLGAVPDIAFGIHHFGLTNDHVLVVGGDTLFLNDFDLKELLNHVTSGSCLVTTYSIPDHDVHKFGIVETNQQGIMTSFLEKPDPKETTSRLACPCFYVFDRDALPLIDAFVEESKGQPKETFDATGKFLAYLYPRFNVKTYPISGRIDVGGLKSYIEANAYFAE